MESIRPRHDPGQQDNREDEAVVAAFIWKYLYAPSGPIDGALVDHGVIGAPLQFLTDTSALPATRSRRPAPRPRTSYRIVSSVGPLTLAFVAMLEVGVWASFRFLFVCANGAMNSIPITLPLIAPVLESAVAWATELLLFRVGDGLGW